MSNDKMKSAEILCVGTEILLGDIINTNAAFLSQRLAECGIAVYRQTSVGDNPERLAQALSEALARVDIVITTGGLGPTYDDLTKETVAAYFGKGMVEDKVWLESIVEHFARTGRQMTDNNRKQALIPEGATLLDNKYGTAPGIAINEGGKIVIMLPGPPSELEPMYYDVVRPLLESISGQTIRSRFVNIFGLGESAVESKLKELMENSTNPTIAPYAKDSEVRLRVTASAENEAEALAMCDKAIEKIVNSEVGQFVYGIDMPSPESALVKLLRERGLTLATAESCTGGLIAKRITDIPGSSSVFRGAYVTYTNEIKIGCLGVSADTIAKHTEVSYETAREMAERARILTGADIGISTTGFAGPDGGTDTDPVGTVYIGVSTTEKNDAIRISVSPRKKRETIRFIASTSAIMLAHKQAKGQ